MVAACVERRGCVGSERARKPGAGSRASLGACGAAGRAAQRKRSDGASGKLYEETQDYFRKERLEAQEMYSASSLQLYFQHQQITVTEDMSGVLWALPQLFKIYIKIIRFVTLNNHLYGSL